MKSSSRFTVIFLGTLLLALSLTAWFHPAEEMSETERRQLATFPEVTADSILDASFMSEFETYTLDQFPFRDSFRKLKALNQFYVFRQSDNNDIYIADGYASALVYPLNDTSVQYALKHFQSIYDTYLAKSKASVYTCIIPDKNYYLADANGYPAIDYTALFERIQTGMPYAEYIDITNCLTTASYYKTDTHWNQEFLLPVVDKIIGTMQPNTTVTPERELRTAITDFYGVYYGQASLPMDGETISYYSNATLDNAKVQHLDTGNITSVYDTEKLSSRDPYEFFLSGAVPLLIVENPASKTNKELVVFRDSFGSSLSPLLLDYYKTITLIDTRYVNSRLIGNYVRFTNQDVLFLYSTLILNSSSTFQ